MQFEGALLKEKGVTFAIVVVKFHVLNNTVQADRISNDFYSVFGNVPIILMAQNSKGVPTFYGRKDIVNFLSHINISRIPWKKYTLN